MTAGLTTANGPACFWRLLADEPPEVWDAAALAAGHLLPPEAQADSLAGLLAMTLGEGQFGPGHWRQPGWMRLYYRVKRRIPTGLHERMRRAHRRTALRSFPLGWPVEDRYRQFLWESLREAMLRRGRTAAEFVFFWPHGHTHALVLTHDIETALGQAWAGRLADMEERLGFRSAFNFVAEDYRIDRGLVRDLVARGFEIGTHGLHHDGHEMASRASFERRARQLRPHMERLGAVGYRSPLTHRHPEWLQALEAEYDSSFFDTDPFEPIPGGTMSLWPFLLGRLVELPYTLAQDYTVTELLGHRAPDLWVEKVAHLARWHGMALLNAHPDYLQRPGRWQVYQSFLGLMREQREAWNALPREAARWWLRRATAATDDLVATPGVVLAGARLEHGTVEVLGPASAAV